MCHNDSLSSGGLNLARFLVTDTTDPLQDRDLWEKVVGKLKAGQMPPPAVQKPPAADIHRAVALIEGEYAQRDRAAGPNPGRVTLRRLNRSEYENTVRDLLHVAVHPADDFPVDQSGYGFDNIGDVLSISPLLAEKYLKTASEVARAAIVTPQAQVPSSVQHYTAEQLGQVDKMHLTVERSFPVDGDYEFRGTFYQALKENTHMVGRLFLDGKQVSETPLSFYYAMDRAWVAPNVAVSAGRHRVEADLEMDAGYQGKKPYIDSLDVKGPERQRPPELTASHRSIMICGEHDASCARRIVEPLLRRAYRRPVTEGEVTRIASFIRLATSHGDSFEEGVRLAIQAILVSPDFLFHVERDVPGVTGQHRITDYEMASRLSYFLWSSMPDDALLGLAARQQLHMPAVLRAQVTRMLADPKSEAFTRNFAGQWLQLRNLDTARPDPKRFPDFNDELRADMRQETEMFFDAILHENRSVLDFLDGKFTFLNERLARHYGITDVHGSEFRRYPLAGDERSGVLTQASVLTVSSYPTRTSPVIRGKWILENLLNAPPPPPPPDVPALDEKAVITGTMRQQMEKHRSAPLCASCHSRMDPLGFGLENYNAIGEWRTEENGFPVDAKGTTPAGKSFNTPEQLKEMLRADPLPFVHALTEKLMTYALGRGLERYDRPQVEAVVTHTAAGGYRLQSMIQEIVESMPFQMRMAERGGTAVAESAADAPKGRLQP